MEQCLMNVDGKVGESCVPPIEPAATGSESPQAALGAWLARTKVRARLSRYLGSPTRR